jgi:hypothetical protein
VESIVKKVHVRERDQKPAGAGQFHHTKSDGALAESYDKLAQRDARSWKLTAIGRTPHRKKKKAPSKRANAGHPNERLAPIRTPRDRQHRQHVSPFLSSGGFRGCRPASGWGACATDPLTMLTVPTTIIDQDIKTVSHLSWDERMARLRQRTGGIPPGLD